MENVSLKNIIFLGVKAVIISFIFFGSTILISQIFFFYKTINYELISTMVNLIIFFASIIFIKLANKNSSLKDFYFNLNIIDFINFFFIGSIIGILMSLIPSLLLSTSGLIDVRVNTEFSMEDFIFLLELFSFNTVGFSMPLTILYNCILFWECRKVFDLKYTILFVSVFIGVVFSKFLFEDSLKILLLIPQNIFMLMLMCLTKNIWTIIGFFTFKYSSSLFLFSSGSLSNPLVYFILDRRNPIFVSLLILVFEIIIYIILIFIINIIYNKIYGEKILPI